MKKIKIFVIISMTICLISIAATAYFYLKQKEYAAQLIVLNKELEQSKLKLEKTNYKLVSTIKEISPHIPNNLILKREVINLTITFQVEELIKNLFSPIESQRISSNKILKTECTKDENLIPYLLDYSYDRFGNESYNKAGIDNAIEVLSHMDKRLIEQNRFDITKFIARVDKLEDRKKTQYLLEILKRAIRKNRNLEAKKLLINTLRH